MISFATEGAHLTSSEQERLGSTLRWEIPLRYDGTRTQSASDLGATAKPGRDAPPSALEAMTRSVARGVDASFPVDTWAPYFWLARRSMTRRAKDWQPDLIWSTADPWSGMSLAYHLSRTLKVPWVSDLRDPWTLCPVRSQSRSQLGRLFDRRAERRWMSAATAIGFTSRESLRRHAEAFPNFADKMFSEPNSFDTQTPPKLDLPPATTPGPLRILFFGRFRSTAPADAMVEGLGELVRRGVEPNGAVEIHSVGGLSGKIKERARELGVAHCFKDLQPVPYEEAAETLRSSDLLILSAWEGRPTVIPAKFWDYLPVGRPILSLCVNPEIAEVLHKTGTGIQITPGRSESSARIADVIEGAIQNRSNGMHALDEFLPDTHAITQFGADESTARLAQRFDQLITKGPTR